MDLYESLSKKLDEINKDKNEKYIVEAKKIADMGMDKNSIYELLQIKGCSKEDAKKIASSAYESNPDNYATAQAPSNFLDVKDKIKNTILNGSLDTLNDYQTKYMSKNHQNFIDKVKLARDTKSNTITDEILNEIKPFVENLILTNKGLINNKIANKTNEKEEMEKDLFGVWPVNSIKKRIETDKNNERMINMAKKNKPGDNISFI
jgi:hypothetical protein